jgi:hypothetical protein
MNVEPFLKYALERHRLYLRRAAGQPRPWTEDPVLAKFRFTNNYRELDRTTIWFARAAREPLREQPEVLLATVLFRWFNRIETMDPVFNQPSLFNNLTPFLDLCDSGSLEPIKNVILTTRGKGPYVTGVYIIKTPDGMDKLTGVLWCIEKFMNGNGSGNNTNWLLSAKYMTRSPMSLANAHKWLMSFPYLGSFMAAQIVADLKYTALLRDAHDWETFAASGPGSRAGLNLVYGRAPLHPWNETDWHSKLLDLRREILPVFQEQGWELPHAQDVQNMCCEFSKYSRGSSRNLYK